MQRLDGRVLKQMEPAVLQRFLDKLPKARVIAWVAGRMKRAGFPASEIQELSTMGKYVLVETMFNEVLDPWPKRSRR